MAQINWWRIVAFEVTIILLIILALGYLKPPKWLRRKVMVRGFPWGYYRDALPKSDPGYLNPNNTDFLHDTGTQFGGIEGFGEFGEFTGFGEMGEFGNNFGSGGQH
jgi:hypothetical protein